MITAEQVLDIMQELPDDKDNPMEYDTCLYTDPSDCNNHCIAGEILSRLGYRLPPVDSPLNEAGIYELLDHPLFTLTNFDIDPMAMKILGWAQESADSYSLADNGRAWGLAKKKVMDWYNEEMRG